MNIRYERRQIDRGIRATSRTARIWIDGYLLVTRREKCESLRAFVDRHVRCIQRFAACPYPVGYDLRTRRQNIL